MSLSQNYPDIRPLWMNDYANAGVIDPRCSFARSDSTPSNVHYWSSEDHLSSENLLLQSSDFDTSWSKQGLATPTGGQSDPAGGTDGFTLVEDSNGGYHRVFQSMSQTGDLALTVYAKQTTGTRYLILTLFNASNDYEAAVFDLAGGAAATSSGSSSTYTSVSTSQTASGDSYYKCVLKATGTVTTVSLSLNNSASAGGINSSGLDGYAGDGSSSIDLAFASLSSVGGTDYQPTTTQIHREYAATLKSVAYSGQPRFEYEPTGDRSARGLLIEGQATNLQRYGNAVGSWNLKPHMTITADAAVAPDGSLTAQSVVPTAISQIHYILDTSVSFTSGTTYTSSVFVKSAGYRYIQFGGGSSAFGASAFVNFDLTDGSYTATGMTATATAVGNDWWRLTVTATATATATEGFYLSYVTSKSASRAGHATGDGYSGYLLFGFQTESGSFASSLVNTGTSSSTRTADSLSVATADIGYTGGPVSAVVEVGSGILGPSPRLFSLSSSSQENADVVRNGNPADASDNWNLYTESQNVTQVLIDAPSSGAATKVAVSLETDNYKICAGGGVVTTDTSGVMPKIQTLHVGNRYTTGRTANGTIKRIALYPEALTDTELQALTS